MVAAPFFILGCVRSGTTLLRNLLRQHPNLCCPEETHVFRWGDPFGTKAFLHTYISNPVLCKHRKMDGIPEREYLEILETSTSRGMFMTRYLQAFQRASGMEGRRAFDKTPQNVYGIPLIKDAYPDAKFVAMVRNPLNVVASLREGKVLHVPELVGACAYWNEAASILAYFSTLMPASFYVFHYEDFIKKPSVYLANILEFVGEASAGYSFALTDIKPEKDRYRAVLSEQEAQRVKALCARWMVHFQYLPRLDANSKESLM